ncbi:unnamed protein product [Triticum turgidum subsp. durum]|uniref:Phosphatidic acid phosphatase type 2/haloperoxidase domain-containing protein n=1 Tax=Triticum turgidum subsp. durum TaxID=4567 RepID=A0A9R0RN57_TRITD|nr:unnamed protein product [Triticum turgidum subsp. durum]
MPSPSAPIRVAVPPPYVTSHGAKIARLHMYDWIVLVILVVVDVVLNKIEPFHRFVGSDMLTDLRYPMKDNTVPFWTVPAYDNFTTGVLCHGKASDIKEGHKSFPSGHTSSLVAVSRVDDYRHHWQDVCTGGVLGRSDMDWWLLLCATCNFFLCRLTKMVYGLTQTSSTFIIWKGDTQVQPTAMDHQNSVQNGLFEGSDGLETRARFHEIPKRFWSELKYSPSIPKDSAKPTSVKMPPGSMIPSGNEYSRPSTCPLAARHHAPTTVLLRIESEASTVTPTTAP